MRKTIFALAMALFASSLFAAKEEIYIYTSYKNSEGTSIRHKMKCGDSKCKIEKQATKESITLSKTKRKQILEAFLAETKRFDLKSPPKTGDRLIKIKFEFRLDSKGVEITQRLPVDQLTEVSAEMTTVLKTFLELDLSNLESMQPVTSEEKPAENPEAADRKKY